MKISPKSSTTTLAKPELDGGALGVPPSGKTRLPFALRWRLRFAPGARGVEWMTIFLSLLVAGLLTPQVFHFAHRDDGVRHVWNWLPAWKTLENLEYRLLDARFVARGPIVPRSRDQIAIVAIDEASLQVLRKNPWPFPRDFHAQVIRRLKQAGAKVIALDIGFSSAAPNPASDAALAKAMEEAGNVVLPSYITPQIKNDKGARTVAYFTDTPEDKLDEQTPDVALAYVKRDPDGAVRRYPLSGIVNDETIGSFAALSVAQSKKMLDGDKNTKYQNALKAGIWPDSDGRGQAVPLVSSRLGDKDAPIIKTTPLWFWGPPGTFPTYSYSDVKDAWSLAQLKQRFAGRIVFVGATSQILKDVFPLPSFSGAAASNAGLDDTGDDMNDTSNAAGGEIAGVELHATAAAMLLDGAYLHTSSTSANLAALFGLTLAVGLWTALLREWVGARARAAQRRWAAWNLPGRVHALVWFALYVSLCALPIALFWGAAIWLFAAHHLWTVAAYPMLGASLSAGLALLMLFGVEAAERRKTMSHFSRHVSPDVLEEILAHPEGSYEQPARVHTTVLFTDLQGFTAYAEAREPEEVVAALNAYMSRMVPIVTRYGGNIDKYIGDAIMAFFGVPVPHYDHAARALACAIEMQDECRRFREETGIPFYVRIGIHTGDVIVGYMGAENRSDYTVIGDTVNLASRLESKNKEFDSWIMCSAVTYHAAPEAVSARNASAQIKGKSQAVEVYIVDGPPDDPHRFETWGKAMPNALPAPGHTLPEGAASAPAEPVLALRD